MERKLKEGDLVVTTQKVKKIRAVYGELTEGVIGVIIIDSSIFNNIPVYGVAIDGTIYYLFEDEIEKLEEKC